MNKVDIFLKNDKILKRSLVLLFLLSTAVYFSLSNHIKMIYVYGDELGYYGIARSLANLNGIYIYNTTYLDQKILYDIFIVPAFWFSSKLMQISAISFINAVLVSSGIFPVFILGKNVIKNNFYILLCILLYCFFSDLTFSQTFMSENLYLPLAMWGIVLYEKLINSWLVNKNKKLTLKEYGYSIFLGIFTYLLYMTKEIAIVFIITLLTLVIKKMVNKESLKKEFIQLVLIIITFAIMYIFMKNTIFRGMENRYAVQLHQTNKLFFSKGGVKYWLYASFVYFSSITVSFFILPIIFPILNYKLLSQRQKNLFWFLSFLLIFGIVIVTYIISLVENFGEKNPRTYLRYFSYLYFPFIILFYSIIEKKNIKIDIKKIILNLITVFVLSIIVVKFFRNPRNDSGLEYTILNWFYIFTQGKINLIKWSYSILLIIFIILWSKGKFKIIGISFFIIFFILEVTSSKEATNINKRLFISEKRVLEAIVIDDYIKEHSDKNFLIVNESMNDYQRLLDTYVYAQNVYATFDKDYIDIQDENGIDLNNRKIKSIINNKEYSTLKTVDYIITPNKLERKFKEEGMEYVPNGNFEDFSLLKLHNNKLLPKLESSLLGVQFYTNGAVWEKGNIRIPNGGILFGPYITLSAGKYKVEFTCEFPANSIGEFNIQSEKGKYNITRISSRENKLVIEFELKEETKDVEFTVNNKNSEEFIIKNIQLYKIY